MNRFIELYTDSDDRTGLPEWMQLLWEDAYHLHDGLNFWTDDNGEPAIGRIIEEFKTASHAYVKAGIIAYNVRICRMYRKVTTSFNNFCKKFLGRTVWTINRTIAAADVAIKLMAWGFNQIPANEAQCRPLTRLNDDDLLEVWRIVCRSIPEPDRTAKAIEGVISRLYDVDPDFEGKPMTRRIELNAEQWRQLEEKAARYGMKPKKYLELILDKDLADEPAAPPEPKPKKKPKKQRKNKGFGFTQKLKTVITGGNQSLTTQAHPT